MLEVEQLQSRYGRIPALSGVSLRVFVLYRLQWYESTIVRLRGSACSAP